VIEIHQADRIHQAPSPMLNFSFWCILDKSIFDHLETFVLNNLNIAIDLIIQPHSTYALLNDLSGEHLRKYFMEELMRMAKLAST
jgi:hypothetical protein